MSPILQSNPGAGYFARKTEIDEAVRACLESRWYVLGAQVKAFESEFAAFLGASGGSAGVASGTDALTVALATLRIGEGNAVFLPSHTAVATALAVTQSGATPVFVDVHPKCLTMHASDLQEQIEAVKREGKLKLGAVLPVHLYGQSARIDVICEIARNSGMKVVEDCAQSHGAKRFGRATGTWGEAGAFSFYPTKNLGALGDGGALVSNEEAVVERAKLLREYGWQQRYVSSERGFNSRLDELQAAILRVQLRYLDKGNARRAQIAAFYFERLGESELELPFVHEGNEVVWHQYVVRVANGRDELQSFLKSRGVGTIVHYPVPVHLQPAYAHFSTRALTQTEAAARQVLSLPMYPELRDDEANRVCDEILAWRKTSA